MPIPDGQLYHDGKLGAGTVATTEGSAVNTETAGAEINFGTGVAMQADGTVAPATKAPIYGVALKRTYIAGDRYTDLPNDKWRKGETLGVLRDGTIAVTLSADVKHGQNATVDSSGNFKPAGSSDKIVGVFLTDGNSGETANVQVRISLDASSN